LAFNELRQTRDEKKSKSPSSHEISVKRMFHPSPADQKSGFVSSKNFYSLFTTTSIPIPQGLGNAATRLAVRGDSELLILRGAEGAFFAGLATHF